MGFESAVRPQRVLLSAVAAVLIALAGGDGRIIVGTDIRLIIVGIAITNAIWNGVHLIRRSDMKSNRRLDVAQVCVDAFLALATAAVADAQSSPLIWILLLVPVFDAAVRFGMVGAVLGWLGVSSAYVFMLSVIGSAPGAEQDAVTGGMQQIAAVAGIAIPMLAIVSKLRSQLDSSTQARLVADAQQSQLRGISHAAREFSDAGSPEQALQLMVQTALRLGFDRADVCVRAGDNSWRIQMANGLPAAVNPDLDGLLVRSTIDSSLASVGVSAPGIKELQELHDLGYQAAVVAVVQVSSDEWLGVRAYCASPVAPESPLLESIETLASLCASSWMSARTRESLEEQQKKADFESKHDSLTRIPNRASVHEELSVALSRPASQTAVFFIDLNGFKAINDELGHHAGDATLLGVANRLQSLSTNQIFVARLGGDEFVVLTTGHGRPQLEHLAKAVIAKVIEPIEIDGQLVSVGASVGVAEHVGEDQAALMQRADELMYLAKQESRITNTSGYKFSSDVALAQSA